MDPPETTDEKHPAWVRGLLCVAIASALGAPLAALGARAEMWSFAAGLKLIGAAALCSSLVVTLGCGVLIAGSRRKARGVILMAVIVAMAPAIVIDTQIVRAFSKPVIHDISTDTEDPPEFRSAHIREAPRMNELAYAGTETAAKQAEAYPDLGPLYLQLAPGPTLEIAKRSAEDLGWSIVLEDRADSRLEAVDTSFWFGFKDDICVRIRRHGAGSVIDLRSVSRVGESDVGANATRIRRFIGAVQSRL